MANPLSYQTLSDEELNKKEKELVENTQNLLEELEQIRVEMGRRNRDRIARQPRSLKKENIEIWCPKCDGKGKVHRWEKRKDNPLRADEWYEPCNSCQGTGKMEMNI